MPASNKAALGMLVVACAASAWPRAALALDKQGSAHGGETATEATGFGVSGAVLLGAAFFNPTYAARPDNTGLTLFRYAAHADVDILGPKLSIPIDVNFFTDRERRGGLVLVPTEGDVIAGVTTTWPALGGAIEGGARVEHDRPLDRGGFTQTYVDARGRYLYSASKWFPGLADALVDGDVSGWLTLGVFAVNPTYAARPDNTGRALFRYAFHSEVSVWHDHISLGADTTFFTDSRNKNFVGPSEVDFTGEIIGHAGDFEAHIAYERDMPVDRGGLVQHFAYLLLGWSFDLSKPTTAFTNRNPVLSP